MTGSIRCAPKDWTEQWPKAQKQQNLANTSDLSDCIAVPVLAGLAVGIAFIVLFSLFLGLAILLPQSEYDELDGTAVTRVPAGWWLAPPYGVAHLWITEIAIDPGTRNKVSYDDALWFHRAMDNKGNLAED